MGRFNKIILSIGLSVWVALYSLWYLFDFQQLYFIGQAFMIMCVATILYRQYKSTTTSIFLVLALNQIIDEFLQIATEFRITEYITITIVIFFIFLRKKR